LCDTTTFTSDGAKDKTTPGRRETISGVRVRNRPQRDSSGALRPTHEQVTWIDHRDRIGEVIDSYLATKPKPEMREAIAVLEGSLRIGDRTAGLT
jgi:hypothetical protein